MINPNYQNLIDMDAEEVIDLSKRITRQIQTSLQTEWDAIVMNGRGDPNGQGVANVNISLKIATTGEGNHICQVVIPGRSRRTKYLVPADGDPLGDDEVGGPPDPGEPE